jgi:NAD(P)-dependent dehydrogenase (short-subunit alcohol dehydrogenase family)
MTERVCLLTGASGLLGSAFIRQHAARYRIIGICNRGMLEFATQEQTFFDPIDPTRPILNNAFAVHQISTDLSAPANVDAVVDEVLGKFGQVDLLINAAACRVWSQLTAYGGSLDSASEMFQVNVVAPLRLSAALARKFWAYERDNNIRHNRNIINISSMAGLYVYEDSGQAVYGATKAALNHLTYHIASEFWDIGIRANAVAPDTFPGRVSIEEVIERVIQLDCSTDTGQVVSVSRKVA